MRPRSTILAAAVAGTLLLAACGDDDSSSDTTAATGDTTAGTEVAGDGMGNDCTEGKTLEDGKLTVATGNPTFSPWVENDAPESGEGFEAAVTYAVANELGFSDENVVWIRTGFDEAIQPGQKNFDFNIQQYSITPEREETVSFSDPYYYGAQALVTFADSEFAGATSIADLKSAKLGAATGTTSLATINDVIEPDSEPLVYDTNEDAKAALEANQIDGIVVDLPTAYYIAFGELTNGTVVGQFPREEGTDGDPLGMLFDKDSELIGCVNEALATLKDDGTLAALEEQWLAGSTGVPILTAG